MKKKITLKNMVIGILFMIVLGLLMGNIKKIIDVKKSAEEEFPEGWKIEEYDKYMESKKKVPSDIKGMTQYDKYKMGLDYHNGSDTDNDGLTDKEELEKYNTDPLKSSTSGDTYSDGYKVKNKMDLFKKYPNENNIVSNNKCKEVSLTIDEPTDRAAYVLDKTKEYSLKDFNIKKIYKGYEIYNYSGNIKIDISEIIKKNKIAADDIHAYVYQGAFVYKELADLEECKYDVTGNTLNLQYDFSNKQTYYVYLADKRKINIGAVFGTNASVEKKSNSVSVLVYGFPVVNLIGKTKLTLEYSGSSSENDKKAFLDSFKKYLKKKYGTKMDKKEFKVVSKSEEEIKRKYNFFKKVIPFFKIKLEDSMELQHFAFAYDFKENVPVDYEEVKNNKFDKYVDELPFQNFESKYGKSGNCAGISHLTALLYNQRKMSALGEYDYKINGSIDKIKWTLNNKENRTLTDAGLYDYKDGNFVNEHSGNNDNYLNDGLTKNEKEFINMIGGFWAKANDNIDLNAYMHYSNRKDPTNISVKRSSFSMIDKMIKYLDNGKILDVYMYFKAGYGHAVNVYDYRYIDNDNIVFYVYDSNIPQDSRSGFTLNHSTCQLSVKRMKDDNGKEVFEYIYFPLSGRKNVTYMASSSPSLMEKNAIVIMDENWNVFH